MAEPATELSLDPAAVLAAEEHEVAIVGRSPWYLAWRRLRRNYVALFSLFVFVVIVTSCFLAPVYANQVGPRIFTGLTVNSPVFASYVAPPEITCVGLPLTITVSALWVSFGPVWATWFA